VYVHGVIFLLQKPIVSSKNAVLHAELLYKKREEFSGGLEVSWKRGKGAEREQRQEFKVQDLAGAARVVCCRARVDIHIDHCGSQLVKLSRSAD
jgi:hypothetical protein